MMLRTSVALVAVVTLLCAGAQTALAVDPAGPAYAWGSNTAGQVGDDSTTTRYYPVEVTNMTEVVVADGGNAHSLALASDGTLWAWGYNGYGMLGDGTTTNRLTAVHVLNSAGTANLSNIVGANAGANYSMAVDSSGNVWAWGTNGSGNLGDDTTTTRLLPVQVKDSAGTGTLSDIVAVSCGNMQSLALDEDGCVWSWGGNALARTGESKLPGKVQVSAEGGDFEDVAAIASGSFHQLMLKDDGTVWAWGSNGQGPLGDGTTTNRNYPVQVKDPYDYGYLTDIVAIAGGYEHSVALDENGNVWAWGDNDWGQLGNDSTTDSSLPVRVQGVGGSGFLTNIVQIAACYYYSMALDADGNVYVWGLGPLGVGSGTFCSDTPVKVMGVGGTGYLSGITNIAAGASHAMASSSLQVSGEWDECCANCDGDWVYQNITATTQDRHEITFTCDVDVDPNSNSTYTVMTSDITHNGTANDFTVSVSGMDVTITGGQRGTATPGTYTLQIPVQGDDDGGIGIVTATFTLRHLGDITGEGTVNWYDYFLLYEALNGETAGLCPRALDIDGNGGTEPADLAIEYNLVYVW